MLNKIIISVVAAIEVLTMLPLLFWGLYSLLSSSSIKNISTTEMMLTMVFGVFYAGAVLLGAYKATQNIQRPLRAYLILLIPILIAGAAFYFQHLLA